MENTDNLRKDYGREKLTENSLSGDPFIQFDLWFEDAVNEGIEEPNVMILSTVSESHRPTSRIVLLKEFNKKGLVFFTNYNSKKGKQIGKHPYGALLFPWHGMERQVRIEGKIKKISGSGSDAYFESRPEGSKIAAWASSQSEEIPSRQYLKAQEKEFKQKFQDGRIPRPPEWGGYRLIPDLFEFWQGRENRLHDRFEYKLQKDKWIINRLAP